MKKLFVYLLTCLFLFAPVAHAWDGVAFSSRAGVNPTGLVFAGLPLHSTLSSIRDRSRQDNDFEQNTVGKQYAFASSMNASNPVWDLDGSDFIAQKTYDINQGAMTFVADAGAAEFRDAGQDFSDWETAPAAGLASYRIVITTNNGISYGYMGASNNGGTDIDIYSDYALTTRGWKGRTTPQVSPDTAASYVVYKIIGTTNLAGDQSHIFLGVKPDDGQGVDQTFSSIQDNSLGDFRSMLFYKKDDGHVWIYLSGDGVNTTYEKTDAVIYANGAQASFNQIGFVYNGTTCVIYNNGSVEASTTTGAIPASFFDSHIPLAIGGLNVTSLPAGYLNGQIALYLIYERALTAAEVQRLVLQAWEEGLVSQN